MAHRANGGQSNNIDGARLWGGASGSSNNFAQRLIQRQHDDQRLQKQRDEAKRREEALRTANQKLQRELAAAKAGNKSRDVDEEMGDDDGQVD